MNYITAEELADFQAVQGTNYRPEDKEHHQKLIANGVFAKVDHWRRLIDGHGYETDFKYHWQISGKFRKYAWARIFLPGYRSSLIYFNVGISATNRDDEIVEPYLFYKLDCQRTNGLTKEQEQAFDQYLKDKYPNNEIQWQAIPKVKALQLDWSKLEAILLDFIDKHRQDYLHLVDLLWPQKIARVCWNDFKWTRPSGSHGKSKITPQSQEKEKGFGFEEWLFDLDTQINGYHYGFLQAFNKGHHEGNIYDVKLYAIYDNDQTNTRQYYWIGRICQLEVLTESQRLLAIEKYQQAGIYQRMEAQLQAIGLNGFDFEHVPKNKMLNLRFKAFEGAFTFFECPQLISNPTESIGNNKHYVLLNSPSTYYLEETSFEQYEFKEGHNPAKIGSATISSPSTKFTRHFIHNEIQGKMYEQLVKKYEGTAFQVGTEVLTGCGTFIDLVVRHPKEGDTFYEIKAGYSTLRCIREALGQLLEYTLYPDRQLAKRLIIVSPHSANTKIRTYLEHLRETLGLEIYYQQFDLETGRLVEQFY